MENFECVNIKTLEKIVMGLPSKKGTDEGISSDILKTAFSVISEKLLGLINSGINKLSKGQCPVMGGKHQQSFRYQN